VATRNKPRPDDSPAPQTYYVATSPPPKWDAKTVAALAALVTALAGGVELRVQVGLMAARLDRIEAELRQDARVAGVTP
jgi:hypothetical protein